ncbi:hypothetical protein ARUE_c30330 [Arthrobacter sp. Rue61a]|nr:hypothetical protein ARUE_c30330 [Arthrobacter sp. Rue61a]
MPLRLVSGGNVLLHSPSLALLEGVELALDDVAAFAVLFVATRRSATSGSASFPMAHFRHLRQDQQKALRSIVRTTPVMGGRLSSANTYAGVRGAWSVELNKPMPNVTYNVVVQVDGGLQNTFTIKMDSDGHPVSAKGHVVSTLVGDANRNGYQQRKAGWLGGPGYDGGHAAPSALGFIGEGAGVFPQHEWQNRKAGTPNEIDQAKQLHQQEALRRLGRNETRRRRPAKCSPRKSRQSRHLPLWQFA